MFPSNILRLISATITRRDLLVSMPAPGGRINIEIDEFDEASRVYSIPTSSKKSKQVKSATRKQQWYQNLICLDMAQNICIYSCDNFNSKSLKLINTYVPIIKSVST